MDKSKIGVYAEYRVATDLVSRGYEVFHPIGNASCDLIILKDGKCLRVEVKSSYRYLSGKFRNYPEPEKQHLYDVLAFFLPETGAIVYEPNGII